MTRDARILVVDDDPHLLYATARLLKSAGFEVLEAVSGLDCLRQVRVDKPDMVLLDVALSDLAGSEVCRRIKADPELSDVYLVMLSSSRPTSEEPTEGLGSGADGFIPRPITNRELLARVDALLRLKRAEDALRECTEALRERTAAVSDRGKELKCLYGISRLVERPGITLGEILQGTVDLMPAAWQHPEIACARVTLGRQEFKTTNYRSTAWKQTSALRVSGARAGTLEVCYLVKPPEGSEGPFLKEEHTLLDAIAERLGRVVERMHAEEQLRWYQIIVSTAQDPMSLVDRDYVYRAVNEAYARYAKRRKEEIVGLTAAELLGTETFERDVKPHLDRCFADQEVHYQDWFEVPQEGRKYMDVSYYPMYGEDEQVLGAVVDSRDITALKRVEEALRHERDLVARVMETSPVGIVVMDQEGHITYANAQVEALTGVSREQFMQRRYDDSTWPVVDGEDQALASDLLPFPQMMDTGQPLYDQRCTVLLPDDREVLLSINAAPLLNEQGELDGVVMTVQDITEREEAEEALRSLNEQVQGYAAELEQRVAERTAELRASEARFRTLVERAAIGIVLVDPEGRILESNPALQRMLGYGGERLRGMALTQLIQHAEDGASELYHAFLAGQRGGYRAEGTYVRPDGKLAWVSLLASLVRDGSGAPQFAIIMVEDITERKQTQAALVQAERLAIAGRLAASLTHEISNPLQSVIGCLGLADEALAEGEQVGRYLEVALQELRRVSRIVTRLRNLHRPSTPEEREPTDVELLVEQVLSLSGQKCKDQGVEVVWQKGTDLPTLSVARDRIQQVFLNLVLNALEAMPRGGRLEVQTVSTTRPAGVQVSFRDTGHGIAAADLSQVFEPFYSTKTEGLGLGLFISREVVEQHGGRIRVESKPDEGTRFIVWLPA